MTGVVLKEKNIAYRTGHIGAYTKGQYPHLSIIRDREEVVFDGEETICDREKE